MAALYLFVDKKNNVRQGRIYACERTQQYTTKIAIDFSSTISPLRDASISVSINPAVLFAKRIRRVIFERVSLHLPYIYLTECINKYLQILVNDRLFVSVMFNFT